MTNKEFESLKSKALEQFKTGKSLFGKEGSFAPLLQEFIESALEAELAGYLTEERRQEGNKRNGKKQKKLKSSAGTLTIRTPQDRKSSFEPLLVKKRQTILADSLESKILNLYGKGMSFRDISAHIAELYDTEISATTLSEITDRVLPKIKQWQGRSLEDVYVIIWMDAQYFKVRHNGKVITKVMYNVMGINRHGYKDILGMYIGQSEGAKQWMQILTDLENRGVKDILIACIDNLSGFSEAIASIFPKTEVQSCIVHQIRNSLRYVSYKDYKEVTKDLKLIYGAVSKEIAELELLQFEEKWSEKYPIIIKSWQDNWDKLSTYFQYSQRIRKLIYTTNPIEGYHRQIRKVTKTKGAFPSDDALLKLVYLAYKQVAKKWTSPLQNWSLTVQELALHFEERMKLDLM